MQKGSSRRRGAARKKNKKGLSFFSGLFTIAVIFAAIVFGITVFFKITKIEVEGASRYSQNEVAIASGVSEGDNLILMNKYSVLSKIESQLPYIKSAEVSRRFPDTLLISVEETSPCAFIEVNGIFWLLDEDAKLLGTAMSDELNGLIRVSGATPLAPRAGDLAVFSEADGTKEQILSDALVAMAQAGIIGSVSELDIEKTFDVFFRYRERFTVRLGIPGDLEYKLKTLTNEALEKELETTSSGTIDLSKKKVTRLIPDAAPPSAAPDEGSDEPQGQ